MLSFDAISEYAISQAPRVIVRAGLQIDATSGQNFNAAARVSTGVVAIEAVSGDMFSPRWTLIPETEGAGIWTRIVDDTGQ